MVLSAVAPALIALFVSGAGAQGGPCKIKLAELPPAPELVGFRLGMTVDQVKARVPQVEFGPTDDLGLSKTTINPDFDSRIDKSTFSGVRSVSLEFLDARLSSLWIGYDSSFKWLTLDDFIRGISQSLQLPPAWSPRGFRGQQLKCADFQMSVTLVAGSPSFRIVDQTADDLLATRREAKEEQQTASEEGMQQQAEEVVADKQARVYFPAGCQPPRSIRDSTRVVFKNAAEAEKAGYKQASNCQ